MTLQWSKNRFLVEFQGENDRHSTIIQQINTLNVWLVLPASPQYALPVAPEAMHSSPTSSLLHKQGGPSTLTTAILAAGNSKVQKRLN